MHPAATTAPFQAPSLGRARRLVVKIGSTLLVDGEAAVPRTGWLDQVAQDIASLRATGTGRNQVQRAPSPSARRGCAVAPRPIAIAQPASVAIRAASSLVRMPPAE